MIFRKVFKIILVAIFLLSEVQPLSPSEKQKQKFNLLRNHRRRIDIATTEPNYIFVLPENKTLTFRKSDFEPPILPNVTSMNKFKSMQKHVTDSQISSSTKREKYLEYKKENESDNKNEDENEYDSIIKENIQTERNFVEFVNEMNDDLNAEMNKTNNKKKVIENQFKKSKTKEIISKNERHFDSDLYKVNKKYNKDMNAKEWSDLGLDGWEGAITSKKKDTRFKEK